MRLIGHKNGVPMYEPETIQEARAFMAFLASEKCRHLRDVASCEEDLLALHDAWGLPIPDREIWVVAGG